MRETSPEVRPYRWVDAGSPGVVGYLLAVLASAVLVGPMLLLDSWRAGRCELLDAAG